MRPQAEEDSMKIHLFPFRKSKSPNIPFMKTIFTILFCCLTFYGYSDQIITGNVSVSPNDIETYTVNWDVWGSVYENNANVSWTVSYGTILSSDKMSVTIQWDDVPSWINQTATLEVYEDLGSQSGTLNVDIINFTLGESEECEGILGTPNIFVDFGAGVGIGPQLASGTTSYRFRSYCGIDHGEYSIVNNTTGCNNSWRDLSEDHTPNDVNGYMMLVDGESRKGEIYRTIVTNLTPDFKYEFSAFVANLSNGYEEPKIKFEIRDATNNNFIASSDDILVQYNATNPWQRVSFLFDIPPSATSVFIVIVNEHGNDSGNDFVIDDLSFAKCFPLIIASFSGANTQLKLQTCNSGTASLFSRWPTPSIPFTNPSYKWQISQDGMTWSDISGAGSQNASKDENTPGIFLYRIYAYETNFPNQFVVSNILTFYVQQLVVYPKTYPVYNCNPTPVQLNPEYELKFKDPNGPQLTYTFNWSPGTYLSNSNIENPSISLPPQTPPPANAPTPTPTIYNYTLNVTNNNFLGCQGSSAQTVIHYNPRKVAIPSAFSPNGDGNNDFFRPVNLQDYSGGKFWVYNRYGQTVFYSEGPTLQLFSWDGNFQGYPQPMGGYVWKVEVPGCPTNIINASTGGNQPQGNVSLIR